MPESAFSRFRHDPTNPASLEYRHRRRPCNCHGQHWSPDSTPDSTIDSDYGADPMTAPSHYRPRSGRWIRRGNSIILLDTIDTAWDTADTEWNELQLDRSLNEFETTPPPGVAIPGTTHRLDCPGGCAPLPATRCIAVLRQAIFEAINM